MKTYFMNLLYGGCATSFGCKITVQAANRDEDNSAIFPQQIWAKWRF
jgi:hypothetical protein